MFVPPAILALTSLASGALGLALGLTGAAALALGAWLLREGLVAQDAYAQRAIARRPAIPRKIFAAVLTGAGAGLAALSGASGVLEAAVYAAAAAALHLGAFGIDPLRDKRAEGIDTFQQDRVAKVVDEAEAYLTTIRDRIEGLRDRDLSGRVETFLTQARRLIRQVEEDPRDLSAARRYLGVYLMGARDATVRYADLAQRRADGEARAEYMSLLFDLERNFASRTETLMIDDRSDLDVEIKVLRDRLGRERA
ncbi:MAG: 5-bromo-4-chloroindolyl phosphate hydrolysis family protein [Paracoccaceae bacterium]